MIKDEINLIILRRRTAVHDSEIPKALSDAVDAIPDLSSPSGAKWNGVYELIEKIFGLPRENLYVTYLNKAANAQVRIAKQMPVGEPIHIAVGVCGKNDRSSKSYRSQAEVALRDRPVLSCVAYLWRVEGLDGDQNWEVLEVFARKSSPEASRLQELWPQLVVTEVEVERGRKLTSFVSSTSTALTDSIIRQLYQNSNVVLEGVPGTGKSFAVRDVVEQWRSVTKRELATTSVIVMHPSSSYEDLVEGLRPADGLTAESDYSNYSEIDLTSSGFRPRLGRLAALCKRSAEWPDADHLLVLDELNRANVPKALGELLLVMEHTKRARYDGSRWIPPVEGTVRLTYTGVRFWVPANLYVLATMNTTDRSVAPLDAALRRRFVFMRLEPLTANQVLSLAPSDEASSELFGDVLAVWEAINDDVLRPLLGPDCTLGHSYLFDLANSLLGVDSHEAKAIVKEFMRFKLLPQLIDVVENNGRENDLFSSNRSQLTSLQVQALDALDAVLEDMELLLAVEGDGLGRRLSVVDSREDGKPGPVQTSDSLLDESSSSSSQVEG